MRAPSAPATNPDVEIVLEDGRTLARVDTEPDDALDWARARTMTAALMAESDAPRRPRAGWWTRWMPLDRGGAVLTLVQAACGAARHVRA